MEMRKVRGSNLTRFEEFARDIYENVQEYYSLDISPLNLRGDSKGFYARKKT